MSRKLREEEQIIDEIRAARNKLWREAGGTVAGLARLLSEPSPETPTRARRPRSSPTPRPKGGRTTPRR